MRLWPRRAPRPVATTSAPEARLAAAEAALAALRGDYDALRRRSRADRAEGRDEGLRDAVAAIVAPLDDLARAIASASAAGDPARQAGSAGVAAGLAAVAARFDHALAALGVEILHPRPGDPFDPTFHEAVAAEDAAGSSAAAPSGAPADRSPRVVRLLSRGYLAGGRLLRPAAVTVTR